MLYSDLLNSESFKSKEQLQNQIERLRSELNVIENKKQKYLQAVIANNTMLDAYMDKNCFTKASYGKNLYIYNIDRADSLKIKQSKEGIFFLNQVSAIEISQEIVYKLQYSFPIKYLNQYKIEIEKLAKKARFYRSNTVATNEDFKVTYEIDRWDNRNLKNSYSYQINTYGGYAKLTIFYSEDLPVD